MSSKSAAAFAAQQAIESGEWDRHLHQLNLAVRLRMKHPDYRNPILGRVKFIAGALVEGEFVPDEPTPVELSFDPAWKQPEMKLE